MSALSASLSHPIAHRPRPVGRAPQLLAATGSGRGLRGLLGRVLGGIQDLAEGEFPEAGDDRRDRRQDADNGEREGRRERSRDRDGFDFD
ncbi:MAG: hypothetical protein AB7T37_12325 [Dehalococcoidia bacterium]